MLFNIELSVSSCINSTEIFIDAVYQQITFFYGICMVVGSDATISKQSSIYLFF